jgi:hypothetical protein
MEACVAMTNDNDNVKAYARPRFLRSRWIVRWALFLAALVIGAILILG